MLFPRSVCHPLTVVLKPEASASSTSIFNYLPSVHPMSCQLHDIGCTEDKLLNLFFFEFFVDRCYLVSLNVTHQVASASSPIRIGLETQLWLVHLSLWCTFFTAPQLTHFTPTTPLSTIGQECSAVRAVVLVARYLD